jgi:hypothetical protein
MQKGLFNKHSFSELALLAIFAIGLFSANLIVKMRSLIRVGPPVTLQGAGVTIHLPAERGWQGLTEWQYEMNNCFVILARLNRPVIEVQWRYFLSAPAKNNRDILELVAKQSNGKLEDITTLDGPCPMQFAHLVSPKTEEERFVGVAMLDFGRVLMLEVRSAEDVFYGRDVFITLAQSMEYKQPSELSAGIELLENAQRFGADKFFPSEEGQTLLVRDAARSVRGYERTQIKQDSEGNLRIDKTTVVNTAAIRRKEQTFESANPFRGFRWQNRHSGLSGQGSLFQLDLSNGLLTVREPAGQSRTFEPGPSAVSEMLLDGLVPFFLDSGQPKIVLDIISPEGRITPAIIEAISASDSTARSEELAYAVRVNLISGGKMEFYYAADKKLLGKLTTAGRGGALLWEPSSRQEIDKYFDTLPQRSGPVVRQWSTVSLPNFENK